MPWAFTIFVALNKICPWMLITLHITKCIYEAREKLKYQKDVVNFIILK